MTNVEQVPAYGWRQWVEAHGGQVIDVREPFEWATGTLPGAQLISQGMLPYQMNGLDKEKPVLVVCQSGNRSSQAAAMLAAAGFRKVGNLAGGMMAVAYAI